MKFAFLALVTLLSSTAMADFSGNWQGSGMEKSADGSQLKCPQMKLSLTHTANAFIINSGHFDCGDFTMDFSPYSIEIRGGQLFNNGVLIGTIDQNKFHALLDDPQSKMKVTYDGQIISGLLDFKEAVYDAAGKLYFSVDGSFSR